MNKSPQEILKDRFYRFLHRRSDDGKVVDEIARQFRSRGWTVYAFGGTPRGVHDTGSIYRPRDLDLVFEDDHFEHFASAYEKFIQRKNSFGGIKLKYHNIVIDAWPLSATWAFREGLVPNPSWESLPATTFLNVDGIIIEFAPKVLKRRKVHECGFFEGWNFKTLDINLERNPLPSICVARTLTISKNFGFVISPRLALYLYEMLEKISPFYIEKAQKKHYGQVRFDIHDLRRIKEQIQNYLYADTIKPLVLFPPRLAQSDLFESLKLSPCWDCPDLPAEVKNFIRRDQADSDESFIENLVHTGFEFIGGIKSGLMNKRGRSANRRKRVSRQTHL